MVFFIRFHTPEKSLPYHEINTMFFFVFDILILCFFLLYTSIATGTGVSWNQISSLCEAFTLRILLKLAKYIRQSESRSFRLSSGVYHFSHDTTHTLSNQPYDTNLLRSTSTLFRDVRSWVKLNAWSKPNKNSSSCLSTFFLSLFYFYFI